MGFFDTLKRGARKIYDFGKRGVNRLIDIGGKIRNGIRSGYQTIKRIPVIGSLVDRALDAPLPFIGTSLRSVGSAASNGLDAATSARDTVFGRPAPARSRDVGPD